MDEFKENIFNVTATTTHQQITNIDLHKLSNLTIFIKNQSSTTSATVEMLVSPDGVNWVVESTRMVQPNTTIAILGGIFAKYGAIRYFTSSGTAFLKIWVLTLNPLEHHHPHHKPHHHH